MVHWYVLRRASEPDPLARDDGVGPVRDATLAILETGRQLVTDRDVNSSVQSWLMMGRMAARVDPVSVQKTVVDCGVP